MKPCFQPAQVSLFFLLEIVPLRLQGGHESWMTENAKVLGPEESYVTHPWERHSPYSSPTKYGPESGCMAEGREVFGFLCHS